MIKAPIPREPWWDQYAKLGIAKACSNELSNLTREAAIFWRRKKISSIPRLKRARHYLFMSLKKCYSITPHPSFSTNQIPPIMVPSILILAIYQTSSKRKRMSFFPLHSKILFWSDLDICLVSGQFGTTTRQIDKCLRKPKVKEWNKLLPFLPLIPEKGIIISQCFPPCRILPPLKVVWNRYLKGLANAAS